MTGKALKTAYLILVLVLGIFSGAALAVDPTAVDYSARGSISVTLCESDDTVVTEDIALALYYIAALTPEGYETAEAFAAFAGDVAYFDNRDLVPGLVAYIRENRVDCLMLQSAEEGGAIVFEELPLGLYLVLQTSDTETRFAVDPFLVTVPISEPTEGSLVYDVDASPKAGYVTEITPTPTPTKPPHGGRLPQTGMLMWPVPVLAVSGLALFLTGWFVRRRIYDDE